MTIKEILDALKKAKPEVRVYYDFMNCIPTSVDSSRGYYNEPALGWSPSGYTKTTEKYPVVLDLIRELERSTKNTYFGWKGGEYQYNEDQELWVDNPGDWSDRKITGVRDQGHRFLLITEQES